MGEWLLGERGLAGLRRHHDQIGVEEGRRGDGDRLHARIGDRGLSILLVARIFESKLGDQVARLPLIGVCDHG